MVNGKKLLEIKRKHPIKIVSEVSRVFDDMELHVGSRSTNCFECFTATAELLCVEVGRRIHFLFIGKLSNLFNKCKKFTDYFLG